MYENYDVAIVGAGPAGLFSALRFVDKGLKVILIDQGPDLENRISHRNSAGLTGFGGSGGGINDGKLIFSKITGGRLSEIVDDEILSSYLEISRILWRHFIGEIETDDFTNLSDNKKLIDNARQYNWDLIVSDIIHIGSDLLPLVLNKIRDSLISGGIKLLMNSKIEKVIDADKSDYHTLILGNGYTIYSRNVILAPGRGGAKWLQNICRDINIPFSVGNVDIGVRVEVPFEVTQFLTDNIYEFKLKYSTIKYQDIVRTFCCNPRGIVVKEEHKNFTLVNGYSNKDKNSPNTNFAFLSSIKLTDPDSNPLEFSEHIAHTVNSISNGVMVQRFGDLLLNRRTKTLLNNKVKPTLECEPGDLGLALPYRFITNIIEGLQSLEQFIPGISDDSNLLYAPENKLYSSIIAIDDCMKTPIDGIYVIGDGGGATRGLIHASISGMIAADHIIDNR